MNPIQVTEPFLPPLDEYIEHLKGIWDRNWLTNQGPLTQELENKLREYHELTIPVHCVANGGLGLQIILKALGIRGEIITTPFSYIATASCPLWEGCGVKFADIEEHFLTIDPAAVEAAITPATEAVLATHVFGNPCDVEALDAIAKKHGLALIYDAAHAFGVKINGKSILEWGDASMVSLHATKLFHSVEGGMVVARESAVAEKIEWMRRFGHKGHEDFHGVGINAKMSEFHAAMGLTVLKHIQDIVQSRKILCEAYDTRLSRCGDAVNPVWARENASRNYSYYPVLFRDAATLHYCLTALNEMKIYPRRYFFPCINTVGSLGEADRCLVAEGSSERILCLPLGVNLSLADVLRIAEIITQATT